MLAVSVILVPGSLTKVNAVGATISFDKATYFENASTAIVTITEPDANIDPGSRESITVQSISGGSGTAVHQSLGIIADFQVIRIRGGIETVRDFGPVIFREDGANDGFWTFDMNLRAASLDLAPGDTLKIVWFDRGDGVESVAIASIEGILAILAFDRTEIPVESGQTEEVIVSLFDEGHNINPNDITGVAIRLLPMNNTNGIVGSRESSISLEPTGQCRVISYYNGTAVETGPNTGVFTLRVEFLWGNTDDDLAKIIIHALFGPTETFTLDRNIDMIGGGLQVEVIEVISGDILTLGGTFATPCSEFVVSGPSINGVIAKIPFVAPRNGEIIVDARVPEFGLEAVLMVAILVPVLLLLRRRFR